MSLSILKIVRLTALDISVKLEFKHFYTRDIESTIRLESYPK